MTNNDAEWTVKFQFMECIELTYLHDVPHMRWKFKVNPTMSETLALSLKSHEWTRTKEILKDSRTGDIKRVERPEPRISL